VVEEVHQERVDLAWCVYDRRFSRDRPTGQPLHGASCPVGAVDHKMLDLSFRKDGSHELASTQHLS